MTASNPASLNVADNQGLIPLHVACKFGKVDEADFLMKAKWESLNISER